MNGGWVYRGLSVTGTVMLGFVAVGLANVQPVQTIFSLLPLVGHLTVGHATGMEFLIKASTTTLVLMISLLPMYKPRPRRILDVVSETSRRVLLAVIALSAIGYFDYTYRLPRGTVLVVGGVLFVAVPLWFVAIRDRQRSKGENTVIVGDDPETMQDVIDALEGKVRGHVSPSTGFLRADSQYTGKESISDGGRASSIKGLPRLGGLSKLEEVLVGENIDTAVLAFANPDRAEFFGTLDLLYDYGVSAKVHREHADRVLTKGVDAESLVDVELEPWDWQEYVIKRVFDVAFASFGLIVLSPVILLTTIAIKLDDGGKILYSQERTAAFGETFRVYKFRTMKPESEDPVPNGDEGNDRITTVGRFLRRTHLDEIPQLWSILTGKMSVVGPRAVWTEEENLLEEVADTWRRRWFVKPGLTGLAQINAATSEDPVTKLRYDIAYIRQQSIWFDMKIVIRQLWIVFGDGFKLLLGRSEATGSDD